MKKEFSMNRFELINIVGHQARIIEKFGIGYALQKDQYLTPDYKILQIRKAINHVAKEPPHEGNKNGYSYSFGKFNLSMALFEEVSSEYPNGNYDIITMELACRSGTKQEYIRWLLYQLFGSYHNLNDYGLLGEDGMILSPRLITHGIIISPTYYWRPNKKSEIETLLDNSMIT